MEQTADMAPGPSIALAVREFVAPLEPTGSLDSGKTRLGSDAAPGLGARLHSRIQQRWLQADPAHQAETGVQELLSRPGFTCLVRGRYDLLLAGAPPVLEEIKTSFRPDRILADLDQDPDHPFALQARMYAWIHWRQTGVVPACRLRIVGLVDEAETVVELAFAPEGFSVWVETRLAALHQAHLQALARAQERRQLGTTLGFPFTQPRPGQVELMDQVDAALASGQRLLLQAPTGLGKTAAILFPALRRALAENLQVFYGTPRNSQHEVAEDCVRRLRASGHGIRSVTVRAKERVCPQPEVNCRPEHCPRAELYFDRLKSSGALAELAELGCADPATLAEVADRHCLCPFELALDATRQADVVIADYNYAFAPRATLQRLFGTPEAAARQIILVDEAHNLPARAAEWFSPDLDLAWLAALRKQPALPRNRGLRTRLNGQLKRCQTLLQSLDGPHRMLDLDPHPFFAEEARIGKLLLGAATAGQELAPSHPLLELHYGWSDFCEVLRLRGEEHGISWIPPGRLQITCADAASHLAQRMAAVAGAVLFSGTLKPFPCSRDLCGLGDLATTSGEVRSPFPDRHRKVLVVPQISTLYRQRQQEVPRIAQFLERVLPLRHGNYFVFFSSFDLLDQTRPHLSLPGFRILVQPRRASQDQLQAILTALRNERGIVVLAVQGGSLAEGVDCPGEAVIGCVVVGPPLPRFDLEREHIRQHFQRKYGYGQQYAYTYPAAAKAVQAAGRVIRTPQDRGLLVFMDRRFLDPDYADGFPAGWFQDSPRELVSSAILDDVRRFWDQAGPPE